MPAIPVRPVAKELSEKFNLDAVVIRSGTVSRLESQKTDPNRTIYQYYPVQVISIDFVKTERNRHLFLQSPPEFVIVDEAHGVASDEHNRTQHERHTLVRELARDERRHLVLLTATPHSGIESAFRSLLSLLKPEFGEWNFEALTEEQRAELARHFVQRTRADILRDWEGQHCFPSGSRTMLRMTFRPPTKNFSNAPMPSAPKSSRAAKG